LPLYRTGALDYSGGILLSSFNRRTYPMWSAVLCIKDDQAWVRRVD